MKFWKEIWLEMSKDAQGMGACIREDNKDGEAGEPESLFHESGGVLKGPEHVAPGRQFVLKE